MAYAALVSVAETLSLILKHHQYGVLLEKRRLQSLRKHVMFLGAFLDDFPEKANDLEDRIRDDANEAEDITELLLFEEIRSSSSSGGPRSVDLSPHQSGGSNARKLHPRFRKMCQQLQKVTEAVESIVEEVMGIKNSLAVQDPQLSDSSPPTSSTVPVPTKKDNKKDAMVGFEEDFVAIKSRLCGESCRLEFIPIYGMGGIGKTTLARSAYGDPMIVEYFDIRAWVTVSQDYSTQEMLFTLVDSIKAFNGKFDEEKNSYEKFDEGKHTYEQMAEHVYKSLKGRRYLVVLDDIGVQRLGMIPLHEMRFMDVDQSWILLQQKVFNEQQCPPDLENTGKMIARSCKGLPLAIVVIAGILSTVSQTRASWEDIAKKVNSAVNANNEQFTRILSLSYTHLPHHLRPCFLYMGGFPEDYEIHVSKLVKLWMAEGFMEPSVSKSFEEEAEEYVEDLVRRSLVLVTRRKSNGKIKSCSVHDLVRDLCIRKAREEKFLLYATDRYVDRFLPKGIKDQRRLSIRRSSLTLLSNIDGPIIRTALFFQHCRRLLSFLESFRLLRVLDAVIATFRKFPVEVLKLYHLRLLPDPCAKSFALQNLQTLVVVRNFICAKRIVQMIPNLKKLAVVYDGHELNWQAYHLKNLVHLHQLEKLKINIKSNSCYCFPLEGKLAFPMILKKLTLRGCLFGWEDMATIGSLPHLEVMKLISCNFVGCKWETTEGEFPCLKFLKIETTNLEHWIGESSHFPRLEQLLLCNSQLGKIPDFIGEIPTLQLIEVCRWEKKYLDSAKSIQEEQTSLGNDPPQLRLVPGEIDCTKAVTSAPKVRDYMSFGLKVV
ncbi:UNVERIFIED_CONTAM: putative late blight resistance proteinR1B-12 [Sesamum latifolium]|uniref:Late blight resistance proteinR1B-12 n=1 Tax=Sesamum latifolium TaxID=2727402 RepID=A0AAW2TD02_9LAMI